MDLNGMDLELDLDQVSGEGYSVEDILAEFHSDSGAAAPAIDRQPGPDETRIFQAAPKIEPAPEKQPEPEKKTEPESRKEKKETQSSWSFSERRRSSLPSEEEIRAFMADYGETEVETEPEEAPRYPGEPSFDSRFHVDRRPRRSGVSYAGKHIDQSADEKYTPHAPSEYVSSYTPEEASDAEDETEPKAEEKPGFFARIRQTLIRERQTEKDKELARREAARKISFPKTQELVLPGEEEPEAPSAPEEPTQEPAHDVDEILREAKTHWYTGAPVTPPEENKSAAEPAPEEATEQTSASAPEEPTPEPEYRTRRERREKVRPIPARSERRSGGKASAEEDKKPAAEVSDEDDDLKPAWSRTAAARREYAVVFPDTSASPAIYAEDTPEDEEDAASEEENEGAALRDQDFFPSSFKEYIFSILTSFLYRLRGGVRGTLTMDDEEEDLGDEVAPSFASRYYGSHIRSMRLRLRISLALLAVMGWISLGLPVTGRLNDTAVASFMCLALQLGVTLLCLDVFTGGVLNGVRGKPGLDTMAVLACFVTSVDAIFSGVDGFSATHMPLCLLSSLSLAGVLAASLFSCRGLRKSLRVPAIARRSYTVTGETNVKNGEVTLLKSVRPLKGFVRRTEEAAPDETMFRKLCLPVLALVLLLALVTAAVKRNVHDFFYILSVLLCPAVPFAGLLSFALPFFTGSMRLFPSGAAVAGWSGVSDIGLSKNLIITDRDLFPDGSVEIDTIRIFADADPVDIISYAGSMLTACGSSVSSCFGQLMEKNGGQMRRIENFEYLPGGGMRGVIDSRVVLCGSTDLMQLMNVRIPYRLVNRTSVLLAVDGLLYGIFNMKYDPQPAVRRALIGLMRSGRHPVFAIRDFNITPSMLHESFDIATDGYDFPPYVERFAMSEGTPGPDSKVAAVVCRDGLGPLSDTADIGRSVYVATRANLIITVLGMIAGILTAFVQLLRVGGVGVPFLFFFMLMWAVPVALVGRILRLER